MSSAIEFVLWHIVVIMCSVAWASAGAHFSSLPNTLEVIATINSSTTTVANAAMAGRDQLVVSCGHGRERPAGGVMRPWQGETGWWCHAAMAGRDQLVVSWWVKELSSPWVDSEYKAVKVKLCFGPVSQVDRQWRKTDDDLKKDKTCQFDITERSYDSNINRNTITWTVGREVPKAIYFVRAYALNALGNEVAYGQTSNLFLVEAISGRHASLDIATVVCSAFAIVFLLVFFIVEKWRAKKAALQKK